MTPKCDRQMSFLLALCIGLALAGCATTEPPTQTAILADALPETTVIPGKWASAAEAGEVPDGWLKSYHDPSNGGGRWRSPQEQPGVAYGIS